MKLSTPRGIALNKIAALSLWVASAALMAIATHTPPPGRGIYMAWSLWIQMGAWGFTAWWLTDAVSKRDRLRVAELAEIMARVAVEEQHATQPRGLRRVH